MNTSFVIKSQLLATKFYVPVAPRALIVRSRLSALLAESLRHPLTLVSAPAGFGKTMLLSAWVQSLEASHPLVAWISLDEEDNDPQCFWTYVLSPLDQQDPQRFTLLFKALQLSQAPSLTDILTALINLVLDSDEHFVLILDDYHLITEQQVHTTLSYLVERLPPQLHIIVATRTDPPLPLSLLRAYGHLVEIRTDQLRCTTQETRVFFKDAMNTSLPDTIVEEITTRTEGWLVGLQLLGLSLQSHAYPASLLEEVSGDQRYILDYLTEVVLLQQPQEVQTFLLFTCIVPCLTSSLCDALLQQTGSQQMLKHLEDANLFVVSLDSKRQWYRYHALFAEALYYQLKQTHADLVLTLHHRASLWYAEHDQTTQAISHACLAQQWQWAADLIEHKSVELNALTWGVRKQQLLLLQDWLRQIPVDMIHSRPRFCLAATWMLLPIAPLTVLEPWLNAAQRTLTAQLAILADNEHSSSIPVSQARQELENMFGEAIAYRALLQSFEEDGAAALILCERSQALLSADNFGVRAHLAVTRVFASYTSSVNDAVAAVQIGRAAGSFNQMIGNIGQAISLMGVTAMHMVGTGQLHEIQRLVQQAIQLASQQGASVLPGVASPMFWQAEILREWNQLEAALSCAKEAIELCEQFESTLSLVYLHTGYSVLLRICLSRRDYDGACSALQEFKRIGQSMNPLWCHLQDSRFSTIDQVRLWIASGDLEHATYWAKQLDQRQQYGTPFARERQEVACARVLLAQAESALALKRLEPVLQRVTVGQRWGHVIEIQLLQALAHRINQQETQALNALSEAIHLAEPEGYICSFVDEGSLMEELLFQLRKRECKHKPTPYLNKLLDAFQQKNMAQTQAREPSRAQ